jgi:hypothetical protein
LRIDESTVLVAEAIVSLCKALSNGSDTRPWQERIEDCFSGMTEERIQDLLLAFVEEFDGDKPQRWVDKFKNGNYARFTQRLLGAARYRLLVEALKEDGAVVALAIRRGVRSLTPFAVAWSDALSIVSREQLRTATRTDVLTVNAVQLLVSLDDLLGEKLLGSLPMEVTAATTADLSPWAPEGLDELVARFRTMVTEVSTKRVERANSSLVRKIRGARAALQYSEDGISQAANSLIELIDRIMRESYPPKTVLAWLEANAPGAEGLTFLDKESGKMRPTKRGEALCFVYGGGPVAPREPNQYEGREDPRFIHEVLAITLVAARNKLQDLKHSDEGTQEEREQLLTVLAAIEGALMLGLTIGKLSATPTAVGEIPAA